MAASRPRYTPTMPICRHSAGCFTYQGPLDAALDTLPLYQRRTAWTTLRTRENVELPSGSGPPTGAKTGSQHDETQRHALTGRSEVRRMVRASKLRSRRLLHRGRAPGSDVSGATTPRHASCTAHGALLGERRRARDRDRIHPDVAAVHPAPEEPLLLPLVRRLLRGALRRGARGDAPRPPPAAPP